MMFSCLNIKVCKVSRCPWLKPACLIIRLLFGFARQGGNAVCALPWLKRVTRVSAIIHNFLISGQTILRRHQFATSCKCTRPSTTRRSKEAERESKSTQGITPPLHQREGDSVQFRPTPRPQAGNPARTPCDSVWRHNLIKREKIKCFLFHFRIFTMALTTWVKPKRKSL